MPNKGPMILGVGAALAALGFLWGKKKPAAPTLPEEGVPEEEIPEEGVPEVPGIPPVPANTVTVYLKNPPSGANGWAFTVTSHDEAHNFGSAYYAIDEPITHQVPADWFPLYIGIALFSAPQTRPILEITNVPSLSWYSGYNASLPLITDYGTYYWEPR